LQPIERAPFAPAPLVIPKKLQRDLPYRLKPKLPASTKAFVPKLVRKHTAMILEPHESEVNGELHGMLKELMLME
jgi:hypothetical protein